MSTISDPSNPQYGADCPISLPKPLVDDAGAKAAMGGFAFTTSGLVHDMDQSDRDALIQQAFGPGGGFDGR